MSDRFHCSTRPNHICKIQNANSYVPEPSSVENEIGEEIKRIMVNVMKKIKVN